jgi:uncharacterized protein (DUF58 family)
VVEPLIDTQLLEKLERLTIHWQKSQRGLVGGHHASRFAGAGQEFLDHRNFTQGDDLRAVNWRAYLRLEKLFLKMFQLEPRIPVRLLLDTSQSMGVSNSDTTAVSKFDYARKLAAALCYIGLVRLDAICLQPFSAKLQDSYTASGGRHRFRGASNFLTDLKAAGQTNYMATARSFLARFPQPGLLLVISDFLDDQDCEKPLQFLADYGHELILLHVWSEEDRTPPWEGELELEDAETGQRVELAFDDEARARYTKEFDQHADRIERVALRNTGRYVGLPTTVAIEKAVFGPLVHSEALQ